MADYPKMYAILCSAVDSVIDPLNQIPLAVPYACMLQKALWETEDVFCETDEVEEYDREMENCRFVNDVLHIRESK